MPLPPQRFRPACADRGFLVRRFQASGQEIESHPVVLAVEGPLSTIAFFLVALVALLHAWFLVLEMFLWTKPLGLKTFRNTLEHAQASATLAANQGLYNGFLSAGLVWGLLTSPPSQALAVKTFFLLCVIVAGAYGAMTVSKRIFFIQAVPAILALMILLLS